MFYNYLKTAWRNLLRNPTLSLINLVGLSVSVAFCVLLFFHIRYEQSFDGFHANGDRLFRLEMSDFWNGDPGNESHQLLMPLIVGKEIKSRFPEVKTAVVFEDETVHFGEQLVRADNQVYKEKGVIYADRLGGYAERISVGWWMYGLVGLAAIVVALATISMQVWKAVRSNPVDALRME
ncbi:MAG TPA: hypothetical protein VMH27_15865 [Puia sp.]|nr:hypothetical protein [Puia sp.]